MFFRQSSNCSILIRTDNSTVIAYINKQGGSCSSRLCLLALKLWEFCIQRNLMIKAVHVPGIDNSKTDALSRMPSNDHSYLLPKMFLITFSQIFIPLTIDCFVSHLIINFLIISHGTMILCLLGLMSFQLNGLVIFIYFLLFP